MEDNQNNWKKQLLNWENNEDCSVNVIMTRHCNLRCTHCNINEWLDTKIESFFDLADFDDFLNKLKNIGKKNISILLIGGEVLSNFERLSSFIEKFKDYTLNITTNLVSLPNNFEILKHANISVSIDGLPEDHNKLRGAGTFEKTYNNLNKLKKENYKVHVQSLLPPEYFTSSIHKLNEFLAMMAYVGLKEKEIFTGLAVPFSIDKDKDNLFVQKLSNNIPYKNPCCSYRFMSNFVVNPEGKLWNGYYNVPVEDYCLGTIKDSVEDIRKNYEKCIDKAHFAKDKNCVSCPALQVCWGLYCYNTFKYDKNLKPSDLCDRENIIKKYNEKKFNM